MRSPLGHIRFVLTCGFASHTLKAPAKLQVRAMGFKSLSESSGYPNSRATSDRYSQHSNGAWPPGDVTASWLLSRNEVVGVSHMGHRGCSPAIRQGEFA